LPLRREEAEDACRLALLPTALVAVIDEVPEILSPVLKRVEEAPYGPTAGVETAQGPAGEPDDRAAAGTVGHIPGSVLGVLSPETAHMVEGIVMSGSDGRAAAKAGELRLRGAQTH
jgi:hypothetical protein